MECCGCGGGLCLLMLLAAISAYVIMESSIPNLAQRNIVQGTLLDYAVPCCDDFTITVRTAADIRSVYIDSSLRTYFDEAGFRAEVQPGDQVSLTLFVEPALRLFGDSSVDAAAGLRSDEVVYLPADVSLQVVEGPLDGMTIVWLITSLLLILLVIPEFVRLLLPRPPTSPQTA